MHAVFDSHFHIIDPRFPLISNNGYLPPEFTVDHYRSQVKVLGISGGVVVSGSFQGFDQNYLVNALSELGSGFVGVANLPADIPDSEIEELAFAGVRAARFNLYRGGSEGISELLRLSTRVAAVADMHTELYVDATDLDALEPTLAQLPRVSIDHLGMSGANRGVLLRLVEGGMRVKATGFGRVTLDVAEALRAIHAANPTALMFGSDLPSTRARRPFAATDISLIADALGESALPAVLHENGRSFYRMGSEAADT
ncbi:2-pyrone-4,6-dicarboxylate hydrolase [Arthrobacter agilis]|nr:2-pyrone-4,6-dicarboxylate hydrolase [Arthrobacter agilis]